MFTFSVVVVDPPTDCILSFLFPAETDVLVPVFSQSTDVVVVNFVMVLKFPNVRQVNTNLLVEEHQGNSSQFPFTSNWSWKTDKLSLLSVLSLPRDCSTILNSSFTYLYYHFGSLVLPGLGRAELSLRS